MTLEYVGDALIVRIDGILEPKKEKELKRRISYLMNEYGIKKVVIEMES